MKTHRLKLLMALLCAVCPQSRAQLERIGLELTRPRTILQRIAFSTSGELLATVGAGGTICIWDLSKAIVLHELSPGETRTARDLRRVTDLAWLPGSDQLAIEVCGTAQRVSKITRKIESLPYHQIELWDAREGTRLRTIETQREAIGTVSPLDGKPVSRGSWFRGLVFSPDGTKIAYGSLTKVVVRDVQAGTQRARLWSRDFKRNPAAMVFGAKGERLAASDGVKLVIWTLDDQSSVVVNTGSGIVALGSSADGHTLWCAADGGATVEAFDFRTGEKLQSHFLVKPTRRQYEKVRFLAFGPQCKNVVYERNGLQIRSLESNCEAPLPVTGGHARRGSVAFSPDGQTLAVTGFRNKVEFFRLSGPFAPGTPAPQTKPLPTTGAAEARTKKPDAQRVPLALSIKTRFAVRGPSRSAPRAGKRRWPRLDVEPELPRLLEQLGFNLIQGRGHRRAEHRLTVEIACVATPSQVEGFGVEKLVMGPSGPKKRTVTTHPFPDGVRTVYTNAEVMIKLHLRGSAPVRLSGTHKIPLQGTYLVIADGDRSNYFAPEHAPFNAAVADAKLINAVRELLGPLH